MQNSLYVELGRLELRAGIKQMHFGEQLRYGAIVTNENIQIIDLTYGDIVSIIKKMATPRFIKFAKNQSFLLAQFTDNTVGLYDTKTGRQISKIIGIPTSTAMFQISDNSKKILFGNNQTLCLWSVVKNRLEITSTQWRNTNCYAINHKGDQFVLGTYSGLILVLTHFQLGKVLQMQIKRHKSCIMMIAYNKEDIVSISYDKILLTTTIERLNTGEKCVTYAQVMLETLPRSLNCCSRVIFLIQSQGIYWRTSNNKLTGFNDGLYTVTWNKHTDQLIFVRYNRGVIDWFAST